MAQQDNALINDLMEQVLFLVSHPILNAEEPDQADVVLQFSVVRLTIWRVHAERIELIGKELNEHLSKAIHAIIYVIAGLGQTIGNAGDVEALLGLLLNARGEVWYVIENHILGD